MATEAKNKGLTQQRKRRLTIGDHLIESRLCRHLNRSLLGQFSTSALAIYHSPRFKRTVNFQIADNTSRIAGLP